MGAGSQGGTLIGRDADRGEWNVGFNPKKNKDRQFVEESKHVSIYDKEAVKQRERERLSLGGDPFRSLLSFIPADFRFPPSDLGLSSLLLLITLPKSHTGLSSPPSSPFLTNSLA